MRDRVFYEGVLLGCLAFVLAGLAGLADRPDPPLLPALDLPLSALPGDLPLPAPPRDPYEVEDHEAPNRGHERGTKQDEDDARRREAPR